MASALHLPATRSDPVKQRKLRRFARHFDQLLEDGEDLAAELAL